jgi:hypothetical protein
MPPKSSALFGPPTQPTPFKTGFMDDAVKAVQRTAQSSMRRDITGPHRDQMRPEQKGRQHPTAPVRNEAGMDLLGPFASVIAVKAAGRLNDSRDLPRPCSLSSWLP